MVFREGRPVIVPHVDKSRQITNVRKWEQAFRVYAAIYSQANPSRSAEIWQYVFVINSAAASYMWSDISEYDFAFRHMMATNPLRSWAKIYTQMWNICLTEKITKSFNGNNFQNRGNSTQGRGSKREGKSKTCWRFGKGLPCKYGADCKYPHKCSVCDSSAHGSSACPNKAVTTTAATTAQ